MAIKYNNLVSVDFTAGQQTSLAGSYLTTLLISKNAVTSDKTYEDLTTFQVDYTSTTTDVYNSGLTYFNNGGKSLRIVQRLADEEITQALERIEGDYIVFSCSDVKTTSELQAVGVYLTNLKAPEKKIFTITDQSEDAKDQTKTDSLAQLLGGNPYIAIKYSSINAHADMSIGAYLSLINLDEADSIKDYNFTVETIDAEELTQSEYDTLTSRNYNFNSYYEGKPTMNFGGDALDGNSVVLIWSLIAIEKDIVSAEADYLFTKPTMSDSSVAEIENIINGVLNRYVGNGLLLAGKVYTGASEYHTANGQTYPLIQSNDVLDSGYRTFVLPISSLTDIERASRIAPPVFVYIAEAGSIRKIEIIGEVV